MIENAVAFMYRDYLSKANYILTYCEQYTIRDIIILLERILFYLELFATIISAHKTKPNFAINAHFLQAKNPTAVWGGILRMNRL